MEEGPSAPSELQTTGADPIAAADESSAASPAAGSTATGDAGHIGRYLVLRKLGAGAMGVVFAAYDPELDRKLAIKLLRPSRKHSDRDRIDRMDRMLREAQAMAKLSHPNVISIYDVGTHAGQVYIAMEFVAGRSLREWLDQHPIEGRELEAVRALFVQAGRGLAAAHEVKLVHRDFKPDNVLVGDDGRVRVLDFGLARAVEGVSSALPPASPEQLAQLAQTTDADTDTDTDTNTATPQTSRGSLLDQEMTQVGTLVGTPAYMPPEHLAGQRSDARGDQFSFCVALWEGVYGERPFVGDNIAHMFGALISGRINEPAPERRAAVPDWLHSALVRGLSTEPGERWPSMAALLDALEPPRSNTLRWLIAGGIAAFGVALVLGGWWATREPPQPTLCVGFEAQLVGVWDDDRRAALRSAFDGSGLDYAPATADAVIESLDAWSGAWLTMREDACAATRLRGDQSPELLDLRMACLDRRLDRLAALVDVLDGAEAEVVEQAASAAGNLEGLDACADVEALRGGVGPPPDPRVAVRVGELEAELDRAEALLMAGRYPLGLEAVDPIAPEIQALGWAPLAGRHALIRGRLLDADGQGAAARAALISAVAFATEVDDHPLAAAGLAELVWATRRAHELFVEIDLWSTLATAAVARSHDPLLEARLHRALGKIRWEQARYDDAIAEFERALALREANLGPQHLLVAEARDDLANTYHAKGEIERAREVFLASRALYVAELGPDHPKVAEVDNQLGGLAWRTGDYEGALDYYGRALDIRERVLGKRHPKLCTLIGNLGATYGMMGQFEKSIPYFERAVDILRDDEDQAQLALNLDNLAGAHTELKHNDRARALFAEAYAIRERIYDDRHPELARSLINMAQFELGLGNTSEAKVMLEQALSLREGVEVQQVFRARARWKLAETLWKLHEDPKRVRELLDQARADYVASGMAGSEQAMFEKKAAAILGDQTKSDKPAVER